ERMLSALGLQTVSIWLSERSYEELRRVRHAGTIVSLPHGRKAARVLARRLGARLVEAGLPFGLEASRRFLEQVGLQTGRADAARAFADRETDETAPRLEWTVPHAFLGRRFAFAGDPHYAAAFADMVEELGGRVAATVLIGGAHHLPAEARAALEQRPGTMFEPHREKVRRLFREATRNEVDLLVGTSLGIKNIVPEVPWLEFGFPSEHTHFLKEEPFLGFTGALALLSRMANELVKGLQGAGV
ncbi:MAG: nitrogenase component 1, partial [Elusimicrobia bacterium]|nr:nitrogenase component 1 [Elusimicrobiota bacterium]